MQIQKQVVFITGGGSGMGAKTAMVLSGLGAKVVVFDRDKEAADRIAKECNGEAFCGDVCVEEDVNNALLETQEKLGVARIVVNCAGILYGARVVGKERLMPLEDFKRSIDINLVGTFNVMRLAAGLLTTSEPIGADEERGVIINTSSIAAFEGQIGQTAYSASKAGVVGMTLPMAREMARFGIRVVAIAPGLVETPMLGNIDAKASENLIAQTLYPKRLLQTEEFAKFVATIIENRAMNGSTYRLDGGVRLQ